MGLEKLSHYICMHFALHLHYFLCTAYNISINLYYNRTTFSLLLYFLPPRPIPFKVILYYNRMLFVLYLFVNQYSFNVNSYLNYWFTFKKKKKSINKNKEIDNKIDVQYQYCTWNKKQENKEPPHRAPTAPLKVQKWLDCSAKVVQIELIFAHCTQKVVHLQ
jgi:hypothetical protein